MGEGATGGDIASPSTFEPEIELSLDHDEDDVDIHESDNEFFYGSLSDEEYFQ